MKHKIFNRQIRLANLLMKIKAIGVNTRNKLVLRVNDYYRVKRQEY